MSTTIYDLNYDFEQQNGHFMIITRNGKYGLHSNDLANIQVNMLKSNAIDKLLPIEIEEIDFNVKLYYGITSKRMLSHVLREKKLSINEYYQLLYHIVSAIEASKEYMLDENNFILHEDFIFIDKGFQDIYLTYLPLTQIAQKPQVKDELRELLFTLVGHVQELTGDGVQQLTNYLHDTSFNLAEMKKKLNTLRNHPAAARAQSVAKVEPKHPIPTPTPVTTEKNEAAPKPSPKKKKTNKNTNDNKKQHQQERKAKQQKQAVETTDKESTRPSKVIVFCIALLGIAGVWKLYETMPSEAMLYVSIGLSLLVLTIAYFFTFVYKKGNKPTKDNVEPVPLKKQGKAVRKQQKKQHANEGITPNQVDIQQEEKNAQQQVSAAVDSKNYFNNLHNQTTLLSQPDATVLLNEEMPRDNTASLEVSRNGRLEKIHINQDPFIIGRNPSAAHYVEDTVGISRTHIEITHVGDAFAVKDLGSKNGSKLNGQVMVAYKVYDLHDGDVIKIGKIDYTFSKG